MGNKRFCLTEHIFRNPERRKPLQVTTSTTFEKIQNPKEHKTNMVFSPSPIVNDPKCKPKIESISTEKFFPLFLSSTNLTSLSDNTLQYSSCPCLLSQPLLTKFARELRLPSMRRARSRILSVRSLGLYPLRAILSTNSNASSA